MGKNIIQPKPLKNYWIVADTTDGWIALWSMSYQKRESINKYLEGLDQAGNTKYWRAELKKGYRCIKVNVTFEIVEK